MITGMIAFLVITTPILTAVALSFIYGYADDGVNNQDVAEQCRQQLWLSTHKEEIEGE